MSRRSLSLLGKSVHVDFHLYLHVVVSSLMISAVLFSTIATSYSELLYTEFSLKISLIGLSVLVLVEIVHRSKSAPVLCALMAVLMFLNYYILVAVTYRLLIAIKLIHVTQLLLWTRLKNALFTISPRIVYVYTWSVLYTTISTYSKLLPLENYAKTLLVAVIATLMTPLFLIGSKVLREATIKAGSLLSAIITRAIFMGVRRVKRPCDRFTNKIRSLLGKTHIIVLEKRLNDLFASKIRALLGGAIIIDLDKYSQKISSKLVILSKKPLEGSDIDVETCTTRKLEVLLSRLIRSCRVLEDVVLESIRIRVIKLVERLHHAFEYSLTIIPLVLGLLMLLAMVIYVLTVP